MLLLFWFLLPRSSLVLSALVLKVPQIWIPLCTVGGFLIFTLGEPICYFLLCWYSLYLLFLPQKLVAGGLLHHLAVPKVSVGNFSLLLFVLFISFAIRSWLQVDLYTTWPSQRFLMVTFPVMYFHVGCYAPVTIKKEMGGAAEQAKCESFTK